MSSARDTQDAPLGPLYRAVERVDGVPGYVAPYTDVVLKTPGDSDLRKGLRALSPSPHARVPRAYAEAHAELRGRGTRYFFADADEEPGPGGIVAEEVEGLAEDLGPLPHEYAVGGERVIEVFEHGSEGLGAEVRGMNLDLEFMSMGALSDWAQFLRGPGQWGITCRDKRTRLLLGIAFCKITRVDRWISPTGAVMQIEWLAADGDYEGLGIASEILVRILASNREGLFKFRAGVVNPVALLVDAGNYRAMALYERYSLRVVAPSRFSPDEQLYEDRHDYLYMVQDTDPEERAAVPRVYEWNGPPILVHRIKEHRVRAALAFFFPGLVRPEIEYYPDPAPPWNTLAEELVALYARLDPDVHFQWNHEPGEQVSLSVERGGVVLFSGGSIEPRVAAGTDLSLGLALHFGSNDVWRLAVLAVARLIELLPLVTELSFFSMSSEDEGREVAVGVAAQELAVTPVPA